jgi:hypothetical protein
MHARAGLASGFRLRTRAALKLIVLSLLGVGCANGLQTLTGAGGSAASGSDAGSGDAIADGPIACRHASECTSLADACNVGACLDNLCVKYPSNETGSCDDGLFCTYNDVCTMGVCKGTPKMCFAALDGGTDPCHTPTCDEAMKGCIATPANDGALCTPSDLCFVGGTCSGGTCLPTQAVDCSSLDDACSKGSCDMGFCKPVAVADATPCKGVAAGPCATGACFSGVCTPMPANEGAACDDGLFCTIDDACKQGKCTGVPNPCGPTDGCHTNTCSESLQQCTSTENADGTPCNDGDVCNADKACSAGVCTGGMPANDGVACTPTMACIVGATCMQGVCGGGTSPTVYFADWFDDASKGWTLDPEWEIGPAKASTCQTWGHPDPATDYPPSASNGLAGVVIGGCADASTTHPFGYLTSPAFDTSGATGSVIFGYYRWLNSGGKWMTNTVDVYDGNAWQNLWTDTSDITDMAWTYVSWDVTANKNPKMQVRFGFEVGNVSIQSMGSWNVDDVMVANAKCP